MTRWALRVLAGVLGLLLGVYAVPAPVQSPAGQPVDAPAVRHQLGNHNYPAQLSRLVPAGGFRKACNTTGTATASGVPEASVVWRITRLVQHRLQALGATVRLTRTSNRQDRWGPCVDARGRFGGRVGARLTVSVHADGAPSGDRGFHVIAPVRQRGPTAASLRLARALRSGFDDHRLARSNYIGGGSALSIRSDLATLNLSTVPVAMLEIGNMANRADARRMTSRTGQARYAAAIVAGIRDFLRR
jgi:N-acetylmuramoyl-L-alanine amidase